MPSNTLLGPLAGLSATQPAAGPGAESDAAAAQRGFARALDAARQAPQQDMQARQAPPDKQAQPLPREAEPQASPLRPADAEARAGNEPAPRPTPATARKSDAKGNEGAARPNGRNDTSAQSKAGAEAASAADRPAPDAAPAVAADGAAVAATDGSSPLAAWLGQVPGRATLPAAGARAGTEAANDARHARPGAAAQRGARAAGEAFDALAQAAGSGRAGGAGGSADPHAGSALSARSEAASAALLPTGAAGGPALAGSFGATLAAWPAASASGPLPEARLAASPGHPNFGPELGAQLTLFVRGGVQAARLQLHPAELGPVTVQIQLDGRAAQVHLAADNAFTRQALDAALPTLAASLREAGLTLTGGGVFEQPRQAPSQDGRDGNGAQGGDTGPTPPGQAPSAADAASFGVRRRGVVDLVA